MKYENDSTEKLTKKINPKISNVNLITAEVSSGKVNSHLPGPTHMWLFWECSLEFKGSVQNP